MAKAVRPTATDGKAPTPQTWWQWLLVYPALVGLLLTAVPQWVTVVQAWFEDIPSAQLAEAKRQSELWKDNLDCTSAPMEFFSNPDNIKVDATICKSGDVFVRIFTPDNKGRYYWVDIETLLNSSMVSNSIFAAYASEAITAPMLMAQSSFVMCQRFLDQRYLLRVLNVGGACFDETVDTFTGAVVSKSASQCRQTC